MINQEAIKMLTAKVECMQRETSGTDFDCNFRNCYKCDLNYEQGTIGNQIEALGMAISALQAQEVKIQHSAKDTNVLCKDTINRQDALDAIGKCTDIYVNNLPTMVDKAEAYKALNKVPSAQPTLCGYDIKHLMIIAEVLRKENLPPERVAEALTDIERIVSIVRDEFEETLRKAMEQCKI